MTNALTELKEAIEESGHKVSDIDFCRFSMNRVNLELEAPITTELFHVLNTEYDSGYGSQELGATVVFKDGNWLERGEYDGSEWWEYKSTPTKGEVLSKYQNEENIARYKRTLDRDDLDERTRSVYIEMLATEQVKEIAK